MTVGVLADPGLPIKIAQSLVSTLEQKLAAQVDAECTWRVEVSQETLPLTRSGEIPLMEHAEELKQSKHWNYVVYLTDLPRPTGNEPMISEIDPSLGAALVCVPALGALNVTKRTTRLLVDLITSMHTHPGSTGSPNNTPTEPSDETSAGTRTGALPSGAGRWNPVSVVPSSGHGAVSYLILRGVPGRVRLLAGMVRSNRPGRLLSALSSSVAAAAATGAFGIFYASIWNMADALHPLRLSMISVLAITALSTWLIVSNGLWNKVRRSSEPRQALWDNAATVLTVALSVALMYAVLYTVILGGALAVISGDYLQSQLGHPVSVLDYAQLSWLAASLGTIAGALGSNFDSNAMIREATYSRREHERRKLADSYDD